MFVAKLLKSSFNSRKELLPNPRCGTSLVEIKLLSPGESAVSTTIGGSPTLEPGFRSRSRSPEPRSNGFYSEPEPEQEQVKINLLRSSGQKRLLVRNGEEIGDIFCVTKLVIYNIIVIAQ